MNYNNVCSTITLPGLAVKLNEDRPILSHVCQVTSNIQHSTLDSGSWFSNVIKFVIEIWVAGRPQAACSFHAVLWITTAILVQRKSSPNVHGSSTIGTSSSAVAERPRDASCLSIVSFNSIPQTHSSIITYFGFRFTNAYNELLFCSLRCNVETSCHKHFVVRLPPSTNSTAYCYQRWVSSTCHGLAALCLWHLTVAALTTRNEARVQNSNFFIPGTPRAFDAPVMRVPVGILPWCLVRKN